MILTEHGKSYTAKAFPRIRNGTPVRVRLCDGQEVVGHVGVCLEYHLLIQKRYEPIWPDEVEELIIQEGGA